MEMKYFAILLDTNSLEFQDNCWDECEWLAAFTTMTIEREEKKQSETNGKVVTLYFHTHID